MPDYTSHDIAEALNARWYGTGLKITVDRSPISWLADTFTLTTGYTGCPAMHLPEQDTAGYDLAGAIERTDAALKYTLLRAIAQLRTKQVQPAR